MSGADRTAAMGPETNVPRPTGDGPGRRLRSLGNARADVNPNAMTKGTHGQAASELSRTTNDSQRFTIHAR